VNGASLSVASGEMVGLIGPNGAGKSTLLKAILGLQPRNAGTVLLDGQDFFALSSRERARKVAFLPQERRVEWRLPARDVVMLGRYPHHSGFGGPSPEDKAAVERALADVDGAALMDRPVSVLSGGERTRVLLARALAVEAPVVLVDEPVNALDPYHALHVMEILRERAVRGAAVVAVVHDLALAARYMDRLVLLHEGAVMAEGAPAHVLRADQLAHAYRVQALHGTENDHPWVLPWSRLS
jgi:iron complex transport system ATP-binding protein